MDRLIASAVAVLVVVASVTACSSEATTMASSPSTMPSQQDKGTVRLGSTEIAGGIQATWDTYPGGGCDLHALRVAVNGPSVVGVEVPFVGAVPPSVIDLAGYTVSCGVEAPRRATVVVNSLAPSDGADYWSAWAHAGGVEIRVDSVPETQALSIRLNLVEVSGFVLSEGKAKQSVDVNSDGVPDWDLSSSANAGLSFRVFKQ